MKLLQQLKDNIEDSMSKKSVAFLRMFIVVWSIIIIALSFTIDNPYILAGIIAYEVLP